MRYLRDVLNALRLMKPGEADHRREEQREARMRELERKQQAGLVKLYISHGAGWMPPSRLVGESPPKWKWEVDWFIVEPRNDRLRLERQVESLRRAGRTVIPIWAEPYANHPDGPCISLAPERKDRDVPPDEAA